jgi:hypothetical protein
MDLVKENTANLEELVEYQKKKQDIEHSLDKSQNSVNAEISGIPRKEIDQRDQLINLVKIQAREIEVLKAEIEFLIRKPIAKQYHHDYPANEEKSIPENPAAAAETLELTESEHAVTNSQL